MFDFVPALPALLPPILRPTRRSHLLSHKPSRLSHAMRILSFPLLAIAAQEGLATMVDPSSFSKSSFDYIVVGAGTAGLVVASRLAEIPGVKVGVLESGKSVLTDPLVNTPALWGANLMNDNVSVWLNTVPQVHADGFQLPLQRGRAVGGSSALNLMAWMRGSREDYEQWAALGNPGWDFDGLLPYFKKSESVLLPNSTDSFLGIPTSNPSQVQDTASRLYGSNGPIQASQGEHFRDLAKWLAESLATSGVPINETPEAGNVSGVANTYMSVDRRTGSRSYSASAYLQNSARPPVVLTGAQVSRIVFTTDGDGDGGSLRAHGVEFMVDNQTFVVEASKEVIVSAGAIETPKLLELSGIGDRHILSRAGINTLIDLPGVGENYQDHVGVISDFLVKPGVETLDQIRISPTFAAEQLAQYNENKTGVFADTGLSTFAFFPLSTVVPVDALATLNRDLDQQLSRTSLTPLQQAQYKIQRATLNTSRPTMEIFMFSQGGLTRVPARNDSSYISLFSVVTHPFSRGSIHLNGSNASTDPILDPNIFAVKYDLESLIQTTRFARQVASVEPIASRLVGPNTPPPSVQTDEDFKQFIFGAVSTVAHPIGTAPLAPREIGGVVDPDLRVYGTSNVRVVDASIFPLQLSAHPQSTLYAVAEKAADIIKSAHA